MSINDGSSDFTIRFPDNQVIKCHRNILERLEYFKAMFVNNMKESLSNELFLVDESYEAVYELISDLYRYKYHAAQAIDHSSYWESQSPALSSSLLCELMILADKWNHTNLLDRCMNVEITDDSLITMLNYLQILPEKFQDKVFKYIETHPSFCEKSVLDLDYETIENVCKLYPDSPVILYGLLNWTTKSRISQMERILSLLNWEAIFNSRSPLLRDIFTLSSGIPSFPLYSHLFAHVGSLLLLKGKYDDISGLIVPLSEFHPEKIIFGDVREHCLPLHGRYTRMGFIYDKEPNWFLELPTFKSKIGYKMRDGRPEYSVSYKVEDPEQIRKFDLFDDIFIEMFNLKVKNRFKMYNDINKSDFGSFLFYPKDWKGELTEQPPLLIAKTSSVQQDFRDGVTNEQIDPLTVKNKVHTIRVLLELSLYSKGGRLVLTKKIHRLYIDDHVPPKK